MPSPTLQDFVAALVHGCEGLLEVRALPSRRTAFFAPLDGRGLSRFIQLHRQQNLYLGVATRRDASSGALENCRHLGALFADIDFKRTPEASAREALGRFVFPPSLVVHSGGGLHPYWLL